MADVAAPPRCAASRVMATPELLVLIILQVDDVRTLLLAQRVNSSFRAIITGMPTLQRRLFFLPAREDDDDDDDDDDDAPPPLERHETGHLVRRVRFNPLLVATFPPFFPRREDDGSWHSGGPRQLFGMMPWIKPEAARNAVMRPGASWRRMLVCDPSPASAELVWRKEYSRGDDEPRVDLLLADAFAGADGAGGGRPHLRMGPLYDLLQELSIQKGPSAEFDLGWRVAKVFTEDGRRREREDLERGVYALLERCVDHAESSPEQPRPFAFRAAVTHLVGCIWGSGNDIPFLRTEDPDIVHFDELCRATTDAASAEEDGSGASP